MNNNVLHASESNEWYTPVPYIEAARDVMGGIDLDPASTIEANQIVKATRIYTVADDGLSGSWPGRVWLNPPYGKEGGESNQARWSHYLIWQYRTGITTQAVLLVNATPGRKWFQSLWDYPICFTDHRIAFISPVGEKNQPTHSNAFVYLGDREDRFAEVFRQFGVVIPAGVVIRGTRQMEMKF